jgi:5'-3' exonuclease
MKIADLPLDALVLVLDADSISYSIIHQLAYRLDPSDEWNMPDLEYVNDKVEDYIYQLYDQVGASHIAGFLGGERCFRYEIAKTKPYKDGRQKTEFQKNWIQYINEYLIQNFGFQFVNGIEADDAVSITVHQLRERGINHIICSNDKDVDQVWGNHYSMNKRQFYYVSEREANWKLESQMITGDPTDNIPGLPNKGKVYVERLFVKGVLSNMAYVHWAYMQYLKGTSEENEAYFQEQKALLTMLTTHDSFIPEIKEIPKLDLPIVDIKALGL